MQDLAIFRYIVFTLWDVRDTEDGRKIKTEAMWTGIQQVWKGVNQQIGNRQITTLKPNSLEINRRESVRLASIGWNNTGKFSYSLEIRQIYDSVYFQIGISRTGDSEPDDLKDLVRKIYKFKPSINAEKHPVQVGDVCCYYAENPDNPTPDQFNSLARNVILSPDDTLVDEIKIYPFEWGYLAIPDSYRYPFPILVTPLNNRPSLKKSALFVHSDVPRLVLYFMKLRRDFLEFERERPLVEINEQKLAKHLLGVPEKATLEVHENQVIHLTKRHNFLIEDVGRIKQRMSAMKANIKNLILLNQDIRGTRQNTELENFLLTDARIAIEQIERDLEFFKARDEEAHLTLETLNVLINVERGKMQRERGEYEQLFVKILAIIGIVLALIDGFSAEFKWYTKVAIVAGGLILGLTWYLKARRKIKRESKKHNVKNSI